MTNNVGISPDYVSEWSIEEAIREIIQNLVDAKDEFNCDGYIEWEDGKALVKDYGKGIQPKHLVMGVSEKKEDAIGQFGEGLKLALLVFARENREIEIWSRGKVITPEIKYNEIYETDMISLNIEDLPPHWAANHTGTSIKFECSEDELEIGKNYFINYHKRNNNEFDWVVKDFVSLPGGNIWINGSLVGEIDNAKYSYHLTGKEAREAINRDRGSIDTEKLSEMIEDKFAGTRSLKLIKGLLQSVKNEESYWEVESVKLYESSIKGDNRKLWKTAITQVFGDDLVLASDSAKANKLAEYEGEKNVVNVRSWRWNDTLKCLGVPTTEDVIKNKTTRTKNVNQKDLTDDELKNLKKAKKLIKKHYKDTGRVIVVEEFIGSDDTQGMYRKKSDKIFIKRSLLKDLQSTLHTLLHETVHKHTYASDCSQYFESILTDIAVDLMMEGE